jgi:hypothetical protein
MVFIPIWTSLLAIDIKYLGSSPSSASETTEASVYSFYLDPIKKEGSETLLFPQQPWH